MSHYTTHRLILVLHFKLCLQNPSEITWLLEFIHIFVMFQVTLGCNSEPQLTVGPAF